MNILFIASEVEGFVKTGGLADVAIILARISHNFKLAGLSGSKKCTFRLATVKKGIIGVNTVVLMIVRTILGNRPYGQDSQNKGNAS